MTDSGTGTRRFFSRRAFATGAAAAAVVPTVLGASAAAPKDKPGEGSGQGNDKGTVRELTLYMENLPNGEMGYGLEPGKASIPGPLIELTEGDTMHIEVVNNLAVAASLHVHGVDYDVASDGTKMNDSVVEPGGGGLMSGAPTPRDRTTTVRGRPAAPATGTITITTWGPNTARAASRRVCTAP